MTDRLAWWFNLLAQFYLYFLFLTIKMLIPGEDLDKVANYGIMIMLKLLGFATLGTASAIYDNRTELMNMASFWIFGHMEIWAPMTISEILLRRLMGALLAPQDLTKTEYVPKGRQPQRRIRKTVSGYLKH